MVAWRVSLFFEYGKIEAKPKRKKEGNEMALQTMQKKNLNNPDDADVHGKIKKETVALDTVDVTRVTFDVGAKWSNDLKDYAGTESCQLPHVALVQSGRLHVAMDDGSEEEFRAGDIMMLPPGHDAWTVGDEPCVFVEFSQGNDYYRH
jgi:ethanolamine utilization protein EutQ (cupin superfamily)